MRHFWSALLAALLTVQTASAQVVAVPTSAGAVPIAQYAALRKGDIHAALTFLHAPALQEWLWASRPAQAEGVLSLAHQLADFGQVARNYSSNPAGMRRAMLSRKGMLQEPRQVGAIIDSNPSLEGSFETVRKAYCAWNSLEDRERQALKSRGHSEEAWRGYELTRRVEILRDIWLASLPTMLPKSVLDPRYPSALLEFLKHAGGYLSNEGYWSVKRDADRAERLAARVAGVRTRLEASGDAAALRSLASVAEQQDVDRARAAFDRVFAGFGEGSVQTEVPPAVPEAILSELETRLPVAVRALADGTPAAAMLDEAERLKPLRVSFKVMPAGAIAQYSPMHDLIELNVEDLSEMLRAEGRNAEELLSDQALLERYALAIVPTHIHEATHARQFRLLARRGFKEPYELYQQAMEVEAFSVQNAFTLAYAKRSPKARETINELDSHPELSRLTQGWLSIGSPVKVVRDNYTSVKAGDRAWSDMLRAARAGVGTFPSTEAELARRRRLPSVERIRLERMGGDSGTFASIKTSSLRRLVANADASSRALANAVTAANDEIMANARRALKIFYSLRPRSPWSGKITSLPSSQTGAP